jgi:hypothetical protein
MSKQELIDFLLEKQGYLKEGAGRLSAKTGVDEDVCLLALREARELVRTEDNEIEGLILKSRWQTAGGEWRESYRASGPSVDGLKDLKELKDDIISSLESLSKVKKKVIKSASKNQYALEVNLPDFHFGKRDGLTIEAQQDLFLECVQEIIEKSSTYSIDCIILPIGNDLLNSEGMSKATTKGTPQDDNADWKITFRAAWIAIIKAINMLSDIAPVKVVTVLGNHDYERCFYLGELLNATFINNEVVDVINNGKDRIYVTYGKNLIGYTHGDKIKPADLPLIMATEAPIEFSKSTVRSWRLGHLHKHVKDEFRGIEVEFLPSLCGSDDWHRSMGYHSDRKAMAYVWDYSGGKVGFVQINK